MIAISSDSGALGCVYFLGPSELSPAVTLYMFPHAVTSLLLIMSFYEDIHPGVSSVDDSLRALDHEGGAVSIISPPILEGSTSLQ